MPSLPRNFNVLIVEDNVADLFLLDQMLQKAQLPIEHIFSAPTLQEATKILKEENINLVLLDLSLPDSLGIEGIKVITEVAPLTTVIVLTGMASSEVALEAIKQNAQDFLVKGQYNSDLLCKSIEYSMERKKIEERTLISEQKYKQVFYNNPFPMWINDEETLQVLEVNDAALKSYGYTRAEFLQLSFHALQVHPTARQTMSLAPSGEQEYLHRKKDGSLMNVELTFYPIQYFQRKAIQVQVNDITEQVRLQNELLFKKQQLVEAVFEAQENERKNIGREIHDNINQVLTAVKLNLSIALDQSAMSNQIINRSINNIASVIDELRKLSKELILPGNLKELGIVHAIEDLMKETFQFTPVKWCLFTGELDESFITEEQKLALYRIIQEQVSNIVKYAEATSVTINLKTSGTQIILGIQDNGKGFDTAKPRFGVGINNIISRAELFHGKVHITSLPGAGCLLEVIINEKKLLVVSKPFVKKLSLAPATED